MNSLELLQKEALGEFQKTLISKEWGDLEKGDFQFFLKTLVAHTYETAIKDCLAMTEITAHSIRKADKTPRYSYSKKAHARNANGELPDGGRWKNCNELADDLIHNLKARLPNNK